VRGAHIACGLRPYKEAKFRAAGIELSPHLFMPVGGPSGSSVNGFEEKDSYEA
jgi:hypothetical protein